MAGILGGEKPAPKPHQYVPTDSRFNLTKLIPLIRHFEWACLGKKRAVQKHGT